MILYEIESYPRLITQFLTYGLFFHLLLIIQTLFLILAVKKRSLFAWFGLYTFEIAVFVLSTVLNFGQGNHYRLYEVAHIAMWLFLIMIVVTVTIQLIIGNRKWAATYVIEGSILGRCILGVFAWDFVAICLSIGFIGILLTTIWVHRNVKIK